jgi:hypothetical protein
VKRPNFPPFHFHLPIAAFPHYPKVMVFWGTNPAVAEYTHLTPWPQTSRPRVFAPGEAQSPSGMPSRLSSRRRQLSASISEYLTRSWAQSWFQRETLYWVCWK